MLFGVGGVICAALAQGRRDKARASQLFTLTIVFGTAAMVAFLVVMLLFMEPITTVLAMGDATLQKLMAAYLTPLMFTGPAMMLSSGVALFIRSDGSPKITASIVIIANVVNLVLDFVLIQFLKTGIAGAGISTAVGYAVGILFVLPYLFSKKRSFRFYFPKRGKSKVLRDISRVGMPKALTQLTSLLRSMALNAIVMASLGALGMSAMTVCINVLMIAVIFVSGTSDTLLPIVGTLYGERDYFGVRSTVKIAYRVLIAACAALSVFFMTAPTLVGGWFGITSAEGLAVLTPALRLFALCLPFYGINTILQNFYTTTGREKLASFMVTMDGFVFVTCFALLWVRVDANLLWLCYLCSELTTLAIVAVIGRKIRRKEQVSGVLLMREQNEEGVLWDITIPATIEQASGLSGQVIDFCAQHGVDCVTANRMGVAVEEMAANTAKYGHKEGKSGFIDILIHITTEKLLLRLRDDGIPFDPVSFLPGDEEQGLAKGGIQVVKKLAHSIDYARQIGFNSTVITFDRAV
jgi:Na+-driven multidrug efflux pump/anti-sigma regulatory factor (Ser/Thr protein kinase)